MSAFNQTGQKVGVQFNAKAENETLADLQNSIAAWHKATMPDAEPFHCLCKAEDELDELFDAEEGGSYNQCADEAADVFIALAAYCALRGINLEDAARKKLAVVRSRTYGPPDARGCHQHVEAAP
jgi:hypothetical protein